MMYTVHRLYFFCVPDIVTIQSYVKMSFEGLSDAHTDSDHAIEKSSEYQRRRYYAKVS